MYCHEQEIIDTCRAALEDPRTVARVILTEGNYIVRSTAVSRVGILLTVGALVFLAAWWSRHWYRNRSKGDPEPA